MAERRMVSKVISISEKVNSLSLFGRLLYTWMIPHTDDFGRMPGSPAKVRALVVPMGDETVKDVEQALTDMASRDLIKWYEVDGEKYIQIVNFDEHQQGLHKRTKSKYPDPPGNSVGTPEISRKFPEIPPELELEEELNTATAAREVETKSSETFPAAYVRVNQRDLTPYQAEVLGKYIDDEGFEESVIVRAIERAGTKGAGISLVLKILNDYAAGGAKTLKGAVAYDAAYQMGKDPPTNKKSRQQQRINRAAELRRLAEEGRVSGQK
jgi:hypothetical protein